MFLGGGLVTQRLWRQTCDLWSRLLVEHGCVTTLEKFAYCAPVTSNIIWYQPMGNDAHDWEGTVVCRNTGRVL